MASSAASTSSTTCSPTWRASTWPTPRRRRSIAAAPWSGPCHAKVASYGARALDRCLEGVTIPTVVHLCYGYPGAGGQQHEYEYPELLPMLLETRIGGFSMEFARSGYDPAVLGGCGDRLVMFGCVDPGEAPPEPLEAVL